ncbi:MAG: dTDP-4-dehydrorhamnose reductase [Endomicrobiales bacterium]|nr:dTDP-4-dehydrorhamnose reductase [Endomicrobiales bacterium]
MKIIITGVTGLLGNQLAKTLINNHSVIGISKSNISPICKTINVDITDAIATYNAITKENPDIVIHCAALSNVDECERNPQEAYKINALGTRNIAVSCQRFDTKLLYISTDYVFTSQNTISGGFNEFDTTNPCNIYAKSKLAGENYVKELLNKFWIVRTSWLFGNGKANFVTQFLSNIKDGKPYKAATDMISSPTSVCELSEAISILIKTDLFGTYHLSNSGFASRYEIALYLAKLFKVSENKITKTTLKELSLPAKRPNFSGLNNLVWALEGFNKLSAWQDAIENFVFENGVNK